MIFKYSLLYRGNLKEPIQLQLSQKQNLFSQFVAAILKSRLNFEHSQKRDNPHSGICGLRKMCLAKSKKKNPIKEASSRSNMVTESKHC